MERQLARFMVMEQTFDTEGWAEIVKELEDETEVIKRQLLAATTWETVKFLQGKSEQCFSIMHLSDAVANIKAQLLSLEDEDADV